MSKPIIFYDIPSKDTPPKAWSANTWKARFALNIKGIPYKTVWVEYPDIEAVVRPLGALPTEHKADGSPLYTLPVIVDPNTDTVLSESALIVRYLDKAYPDTHRLIPAGTDALHAAFGVAAASVINPHLRPIIVPEAHGHLLPRSADYFRATREVAWGKRLEDIAPPGPVRDKYWEGVKKAFATYAQWLKADGVDKPFFLEDRIGFADVTVAGTLWWIRTILGEDSKEWADLLTWDGGRWARFVEAFKKYEHVDVGELAVV